ncbi:MAG: hypothetical protein K0S56_931 [Microvirga sp.]|jgi:excisionase family DNA binding protein|nr:hypothetical protein [Microvirga sp.]
MRKPEMRERRRSYEAAGILGISVRSVQSLAAKGELPGAAKVGGLWTFDETALRSWLKAISTPGDVVQTPKPARARQICDPQAWPPLQARKSSEECERALRELRRLK